LDTPKGLKYSINEHCFTWVNRIGRAEIRLRTEMHQNAAKRSLFVNYSSTDWSGSPPYWRATPARSAGDL